MIIAKYMQLDQHGVMNVTQVSILRQENAQLVTLSV
jgi:hypothetical protein